MKRITLLMIAFLGSIALQAQTVLAEQAPDFGSGIVSDYFDGAAVGAFSADDFELTAQSEINSVDIYGFQGDADGDGASETDLISTLATGYSFYIYADNAGVPTGDPTTPGVGVFEAIDMPINDPALTITEDGSGGYLFSLDIAAYNGGTALTLAAGTYWIVAFPHIDETLGSGARFNWLGSTQGSLSQAKLIDPSDMFGAGATSWTDISLLVGDPTFNALSYTINGTVLGIEDQTLAQISLYPNPVQGQLNITLPASVELEAATMYDLLGQATKMNISENNTLNTANLAAGVYILKLETNQGTMTRKVIKQ